MTKRDTRCELARTQPFLKWPGGKRWLVAQLADIVRDVEFSTYREPFLGSGALFFALKPRRAILSDINAELINTYRQVKYKSAQLAETLQALPVNRPTYERMRASIGGPVLERATRFLYLNRTAFGGMYRVNENGGFNVPYGGGDRTPAPLWERSLLKQARTPLRYAKLQTMDFESSLAEARKGDLVYCDPTYTVAHNNNGFIRYNEHNFSWADQERLARCCRSAACRGAFVLVSNAYHPEVLDIFRPPRNITVSRTSRLCPDISHRRKVDEYIFIFPPATRR